MYHVVWDPDTRGILLTDGPEGATSGEIRPVFHEELDLLGLAGQWEYPHTEAPLLWAVGRSYYYDGQLVAQAKGGGFFHVPQVVLYQEKLRLQPVELEGMVCKNAPLMEGLEYRAVEFIDNQYRRQQRKVDVVAVAFSGGKDSLVTLDLTQRALPPDAYEVVFADTTMELACTYEAVERAKTQWPGLHFRTARCHMPASETWQAFGPPSRVHRWCCSVHKTAPTLLLLRQLVGKPDARALVIDGCRREESQRRFGYAAVSVGRKHATQVNASPILTWSAAETFLYLFSRGLGLNRGYRSGFVRVGCAVCPLSSKWWDALVWMTAPSEAQPFVDILLDLGRAKGVPESELTDFVSSGGWKGRAGGRELPNGGNRALITDEKNRLVLRIRQAREHWREWLKTVGEVTREGKGIGHLQAARDGKSYAFKAVTHGSDIEIEFSGMGTADRFLRRDMKAVGYKTAYCVRCRACEAECSYGALEIGQEVRVNEDLCHHCSNCLTMVGKGCWAAKSLTITEEGSKMKLKTYQHFGMRRVWLDEFFSTSDRWWTSHTLGNRQFDAMKLWLVDSELINSNAVTALGKALGRLGTGSQLTWAVIWCNLARNSSLLTWYVTEVPWHLGFSKGDLIDMLPQRFAQSTRQNAITALVSLLRNTPFSGELGVARVELEGSRVAKVAKTVPKALPSLAILYSLYRYAESIDRYALSLSEVRAARTEGPAALFGLDSEEISRELRGLGSRYPKWISVELIRDLDNIYLEPSCRSEEVPSLAG